MENVNQIDLFGQINEIQSPIINLQDGELLYQPDFFNKVESDELFDILLNTIEWKQDKIKMYGRELPLPRLSAWYGDNNKSYKYSGIELNPLPWTHQLLLRKGARRKPCYRFS